MSTTTERARRHTAASVLRRIDDATTVTLVQASGAPQQVESRLRKLDREWDLDRVIETEASLMGILGLALGAFVRPGLLVMPGMVASAVFLYATTGRYPLLPIFRRLGIRTAKEIQRERYALKALRGDFADLGSGDSATSVRSPP